MERLKSLLGLIFLFITLTPGVILTLPKHSTLVKVAMVHSILFGILVFIGFNVYKRPTIEGNVLYDIYSFTPKTRNNDSNYVINKDVENSTTKIGNKCILGNGGGISKPNPLKDYIEDKFNLRQCYVEKKT